jgi:hypothetical protein
MDKRIVVQFLQVLPRNAGVPAFHDVLLEGLASGALPGDRELALSTDDTTVRLERLNHVGDWYEGEVTRVQRDNIPPEAMDDGLLTSRAQSLGHSAVFRYNPALRVLLIERHAVNMTASRFFRYLRRVNTAGRYEALPIANQDVWERYGQMRPRRFSVTMASITEPAAHEGPVGAITSSARRLHEMTNGPVVQIAIRSGGNQEGLEKGVIRKMIEGLLSINDPGYEVTSLSISAENEEDGESEIINFLDDLLVEKGEVELNGLSSLESFNIRNGFLKACFESHMDYIVNHHEQA